VLLVGSRALVHHFPTLDRKPVDWDFICTFEEFQKWTKENKSIIRHCVPLSGDKYHVRDVDGMNYEFELAWDGTSGKFLLDCFDLSNDGDYTVASPATLLFLKLSHRYLKNSPHHLKTMRDIQFLRSQGVELSSEHHDIMSKREAETYVYTHPKLDVSKGEFFADDGVDYKYDHDDIHRIVAIDDKPAYTNYLKDGSPVLTSNEKFFSVSQRVRLLGGLEEAMVLAAERSLIPFNFKQTPEKAFITALNKVTSSITSGKFREFCWEHYDEIVELYWELDGGGYAVKVKNAIENGDLKQYDGNQIKYT